MGNYISTEQNMIFLFAAINQYV